MTGFVCVDKPTGMTSFACCAAARRRLAEKKVGHAGTLDPMATGVLPLLLGRATKLLPFLSSHDKRYTAGIRFCFTSDSGDTTGALTATGAPPPSRAAAKQALAAFRGDILQRPPMLSAKQQDGMRLYALARQGIEIERPACAVTIQRLELLEYDAQSGDGVLDVACSKGTYIRSLCTDLGAALGCGAVMSALRRTGAAGFTLGDCVALDALTPARVRPAQELLTVYPAVTVTAAQAARFVNGGELALERLERGVAGLVRVLSPDGALIGLGEPRDGALWIAWMNEIEKSHLSLS